MSLPNPGALRGRKRSHQIDPNQERNILFWKTGRNKLANPMLLPI
jgi:hypothetical protein